MPEVQKRTDTCCRPGLIIGRAVTWAALLVVSAWAVSTSALDLESDFIVYREDFRNIDPMLGYEAEVNELGGDLIPVSFPGGDLPTTTGESLELVVDSAVSSRSVQLNPTFGNTDSIGVRARFEGLSLDTPSPRVSTSVAATSLDSVPGFLLGVFTSVEFNTQGSTPVATLEINISQFDLMSSATTVLATTSTVLSAPETTALLNGDGYTLDLRLDRSTSQLTGSIEVDGFAEVAMGPLGASAFSGSLFSVMSSLNLIEVVTTGAPRVNLDLFEAYTPFTSEFVVDSSTDFGDSFMGNGVCADDFGNCTLRAAVDESNATPGPGKVTFAPTISTVTLAIPGAGEDFNEAGDIDLLDAIEIRGNGRANTSVNGGAIDRVFHVPSSALDVPARLRNLTVENGLAATGMAGGGIESYGRFHLDRADVRDNTAPIGGGISNRRLMWIDDSVIEGNEGVGRGGGIVGGAFGATGMSPELVMRRSSVVHNIASVVGGAEFVSASRIRIDNSTFSGNEHQQMSMVNGDVLVRQSTFVAPVGIAINVASFGSATTFEVENSAVVGSAACQFSLAPAITIVRSGNNASNDMSCGFIGAGDVEGVDLDLGPLLAAGGARVHSPWLTSPVLEAGDLATCLVSDQVEQSRPFDSDSNGSADCEMGAIEVPEPALSVGLVVCASWLAARVRRRAF